MAGDGHPSFAFRDELSRSFGWPTDGAARSAHSGPMNATLDFPTPARFDQFAATVSSTVPPSVERDWCSEVPAVDPSRLLDYYEHFASVRVLRHHLEP